MGMHLGTHVAVGSIDFVDDEKLFDSLGLLAHLLEHAAEVVDEVLLFLVKRGLLPDS
jgi:hypothetical protein